jgi:hypothetical protein
VSANYLHPGQRANRCISVDPLSHVFIYFTFALMFSAAMILISYGVYDLWPDQWWPKKRLTAWENPIFLRGTME